MASVPSLPHGQVESLAKLLGECGSGSDMSRVLSDRGPVDTSGESTKWRRLYAIVLESQRQHRCWTDVLAFIQALLTPASFVGRVEEFEQRRRELNSVLGFSGLEYGKDGQFRQIDAVGTLAEAADSEVRYQEKLRRQPSAARMNAFIKEKAGL